MSRASWRPVPRSADLHVRIGSLGWHASKQRRARRKFDLESCRSRHGAIRRCHASAMHRCSCIVLSMCTAVCNAAESVWMALDSRRSMRMNAPVDDSVVDSGLTRAVSSKLSLQRTRRLHRETARRRSHTCSGGLAQQAAVRCAGLRLRLTALLIVVASLSCSASSNL